MNTAIECYHTINNRCHDEYITFLIENKYPLPANILQFAVRNNIPQSIMQKLTDTGCHLDNSRNDISHVHYLFSESMILAMSIIFSQSNI